MSVYDPNKRPDNSNADAWHLFLTEHADNRAAFPNGLAFLAAQIAEAIDEAEERGSKKSKDPDYIYNPDDWELTYHWNDSIELFESLEPHAGEVTELATLIEGPPVFLVQVVTTRDEHGDPDETEYKLFFDKDEAQEASKG